MTLLDRPWTGAGAGGVAPSIVGSDRSLGVHTTTGDGAALRIHLFGHARILAAPDAARVLLPPRTLPALAYLLLHRNDAIPRAHLASVLWPDHDESHGRTRLRANLHALGRALPPAPGGWLTSDAENVAWNPRALAWLDIADFERCVADPDRLTEAIALYCGDLALGLDDEWLQSPRDRYRRLYLSALDALLTMHRRQRHFESAIAWGERLLDADPWREDVVRRLASVRYESGDRSGALAELDRFAARLRSEMHAETMPETRALRDALAMGIGPSDSRSESRDVPQVHIDARHLLPFVGRQEEFDFLVERWNRAAQGTGSTVLMSGEAGIGKSRLAGELMRHVEERGGRVLRGSAGFPETSPYQCFVEALRLATPLLAAAQLAPIWLASLARLLPELREHFPEASSQAALDPERAQQRLFEAIVRAILELAKPRPLVLILEDLHWADEATVDAFRFLARRVPLAPVLIVATYRDEEAPGTPALRRLRRELQTQGLAHQVAPRPLDLADVSALLTSAGHPQNSEASELARFLHGRSEGSPLFLTHLIQAGPDPRSSDTPQPLRRLVAGQLDALDAPERTIAEVAALVGQQFTTEVLEEVTGWHARAVADALDTLIRRRMVREVSEIGRFEYGFTHQLVRAAIHDGVPPARAKQRHRRIAVVLERLYPDRLLELAPALARHCEAAGDDAAAAVRHLEAGRHAVDVGAHDVALVHFDRGLALADEPAIRASLLLERETLHDLRGTRDAQRDDLDELERLATVSSNDDLFCDMLHRRFRAARAVGVASAEQADHLEALKRRVKLARQSSRWTRTLALSEAKYFETTGRSDEALSAARAAAEASSESRDLPQLVEALCVLARIEARRGNFSEGSQLLLEASHHAEGSASSTCRVLEQQANQAIKQDDYVRLEELCLQLSQHCAAMGDRKGEAAALSWMAIALLRLDRYGDSLAHFERAHAICLDIDDRPRAATILVNRAHLDMTLGAFSNAAAALERALAIHKSLDDFDGTFSCVDNLSAVCAYMGDGRRAKELALAALDLARHGKSSTFEASALENLAEAEGACGDVLAAIAAMESALSKRREIESSVAVAWGLANLAVWYANAGDFKTACERIATMLTSEGAIRTGNPWPQYCYWAAAQVERASGDRERVPAFLERAHQLMMEQAQRCPTLEIREKFLALRWHRDIAAARQFDRWPDPPQ